MRIFDRKRGTNDTMSDWTKKQRLEAVLNGELADRPPITCYHHFLEYEHGGAKLMADTFLKFQKEYDWDIVKLNPRAVYYYEAWGNTYDYEYYNDVAPTRTSNLIHDYCRALFDIISLLLFIGFNKSKVYNFLMGCRITAFHFSGASFLASDR